MEESKEKNEPSLKKTKTTEIKEDFKLKIEINKWEQKTNKSTGKLEVVFNIELFSEITNKKWSVFHSIQDFIDLITNLSSICINMPDISTFKSLEKEIGSSSIINEASSAIISFMNNISHRSDIFNSSYFIEFLQLENHIDDLKKNEVKEKFHISNLMHEISDILVLEKLDILIVGCAYNLEDSFLSKVNFWSKKDKKGQLNIYKINNNQEKSYILYAQADTDNEVSCLYFIEQSKNILVGYFNGTIDVFDLPEFPDIIQNPINIVPKNSIEISDKKNRIINIGYDSINNIYYTACYKDIIINSGKIDNKKSEISINGSEYDLCGFYYIDKYNNIVDDLIIEIDVKGKLYIGFVNKIIQSLSLLYVITNCPAPISLFKVSFEYNHIYIGDKEGNLEILSFDITKNGKIKKAKVTKIFNSSLAINSKNAFTEITDMITGSFPYKINDIWYNPKKKEILVALANGTIQIFSHFKNFAEYIIYNNNNNKENRCINKIYFSKLNSILYSGRAEKDIYAYQMPENYNSEISRKLQDSNSFELLNGSKLCKNAIDIGHTKTTLYYKRKSFIDSW